MEEIVIDEGEDGTTNFVYQPNFLTENEKLELFNFLDSMQDFHENTNFNNTKVIRQQKWYQTEGHYFCPVWESRYDRWKSFEYNFQLIKIQQKVQEYLNKNGIKATINSCLINKYRNGQDRINAHKDTYKSFGQKPVIVVVSVGDIREIVFKRVHNEQKPKCKTDKTRQNLNYSKNLEEGSLFIMSGCSQMFYTHEVPESDSKNVRYSLTFREFKKMN